MRTRRGLCVVVLTLGSLLTFSTVASADPISITSGSLSYTFGGAVAVDLNGGSFTFSGVTSPFSGIFGPEACGMPVCMPGTTVSLQAQWSSHHMPGTATLDGRTFTGVGSIDADSSIGVLWTGNLVIPSGFTGGTLTAPFMFSGDFAFEEDPSQPFTRVPLTGVGTAALTFRPHGASADYPGALVVQSAQYDFESAAATPEPASMLLLGTGLAGLALRRRRHAANARNT